MKVIVSQRVNGTFALGEEKTVDPNLDGHPFVPGIPGGTGFESQLDHFPRPRNEQFIELADCLRGKGWTVSDPIPDADGSLGPGEDFSGPDGDLAIGDIRDCISERNLSDGGDEQ